MSKLLIDDYPIQVLPKLAKEIGLNEAIFLQQLHYWLNSKSAKKIKGRKWIYNTYEDWNKQFPFWSVATIKRVLTSLSNQNLIIKDNFNKAGFDKTVWYSVNYSELESMSQREGQNDPTRRSNCTNGEGQNDPTNTIDYPETSSETTNNNVSELKNDKQEELKSNFEIIWNEYPKARRTDKAKCLTRYKNALKDGVAHETILQGLLNYKKQIELKKTKNEFIRLSSTWFNNRSWDNTYETEQPNDFSNFDNIDEKWVRG